MRSMPSTNTSVTKHPYTRSALSNAVDRLEQFPLSGRSVPEADNEAVREVIFQRYRIIYWIVSDARIDIIGLVHSSRDLNNPTLQSWIAEH